MIHLSALLLYTAGALVIISPRPRFHLRCRHPRLEGRAGHVQGFRWFFLARPPAGGEGRAEIDFRDSN